MKAGYQRLNHTAADSSVLVWHIADKARELDLHTKLTDQSENMNTKSLVNLVVTGYKKYESSSLATFNKKISDSKVGVLTIQEADDIVPMVFTLNSSDEVYDEDDRDSESESVLLVH